MLKILVLILFPNIVLCGLSPDLLTPIKEFDEGCGYDACPIPMSTDGINVHIVPHTHYELALSRTFDMHYTGLRHGTVNTRVNMKRTLDGVVTELWSNNNRRFTLSDFPYFFKWWSQRDDNVRKMVYSLIRQGRLSFVGGGWSMNDEATTNYQAIIDSFTYTLRKINATFWTCGRPLVAWQADVMGHSREFASLAAQMGYDALFINPISFDDELARMRRWALEMVWRGSDDLGAESDIFTHKLFDGYWSPPGFCFSEMCRDPLLLTSDTVLSNVEERVNEFIDSIYNRQSPNYNSSHVMVIMGHMFSYFDAAMWFSNIDELIKAVNVKGSRGSQKMYLMYSTPACYAKAVKDANIPLETKQDDFMPIAYDKHTYLTGMYTTSPSLKVMAKEVTIYLQMCKQMRVFAMLDNRYNPMFEDLNWISGVFQDHNLITGFSTVSVKSYYAEIMHSTVQRSTLLLKQAWNKLRRSPTDTIYYRCSFNVSRCHQLQGQYYFVHIYNPLGWPVKIPVRIPIKTFGETFAVHDPNGTVINSAVITIPAPVLNMESRVNVTDYEVVFQADVPPVGFKNYFIERIIIRAKRETKGDKDERSMKGDRRSNDGDARLNEQDKPNKGNIISKDRNERCNETDSRTNKDARLNKEELKSIKWDKRSEVRDTKSNKRDIPNTRNTKAKERNAKRIERDEEDLKSADVPTKPYNGDEITNGRDEILNAYGKENIRSNTEDTRSNKGGSILNKEEMTPKKEDKKSNKVGRLKTENTKPNKGDETLINEDTRPNKTDVKSNKTDGGADKDDKIPNEGEKRPSEKDSRSNKSIITPNTDDGRSKRTIIKNMNRKPNKKFFIRQTNPLLEEQTYYDDYDDDDNKTNPQQERRNVSVLLESDFDELRMQQLSENDEEAKLKTPEDITESATPTVILLSSGHINNNASKVSHWSKIADDHNISSLSSGHINKNASKNQSISHWGKIADDHISTMHESIVPNRTTTPKYDNVMKEAVKKLAENNLVPETATDDIAPEDSGRRMEDEPTEELNKRLHEESDKGTIEKTAIGETAEGTVYELTTSDPKATAQEDINEQEEINVIMRKGKAEPIKSFYIENKYIRIQIDSLSTKVKSVTLSNGLQMELDIQFYYYASDEPDKLGRSEQKRPGAIVFRAMEDKPIPVLDWIDVQVYKTSVVEEAHFIYSDWTSFVVRLYADTPVIEIEWMVGPIPVGDNIGKEVFIRYLTNIMHDGIFYTDSNGRQTIKRIRNLRPMFESANHDHVAGNFYPVTSKFSIEDLQTNICFTVFVDRAQGAATLADGEVDFMVHRRILTDAVGMDAPALNQSEYDKNSVARGKHYIYISKADYKPYRIFEKKFAKEIQLAPQVLVSSPNPHGVDSKSEWNKHINQMSFLKTKLPLGIHLLTLEHWGDGAILLRLENYLEKTDTIRRPTKIVFIKQLFTNIYINHVRETTLGANMWKDEFEHKKWNNKEKFVRSFNGFYGADKFPEFLEDEPPKKYAPLDIDNGISLSPQQIRTFVCWYDYIEVEQNG